MIIVTGDRGFIGSELKSHLVAQGKTVHSLDWADRGKTWTTSEPIEWVFHMGAISETNASDWEELTLKNIEDTQHWIEFAEQQGCGITYASSASVYGPWSNAPEWGPTQPLNLYAVSKLAVDNWVAEQSFSVPVQGVRFFNVYGRNETHKVQPSPVCAFIRTAILERKITVWHNQGRTGERDFISIDDVIDAMTALADTKASGVYNVGSGITTSFESIANSIQARIGRESCQTFIVPMPDHMLPAYQWHTVANLNKLQSILPTWNPQTVDEWLDKNFQELYNKISKELLK